MRIRTKGLIYELNEDNSEGKEYNLDGILIFIGEYSYGKRNEKGKEYNTNNILIFEA